ncbi:MAG TPA: glycoside hydrolase family 3 C-terminal domain-containing protein [Spirochaetia bacterium]|nr:glycoside hydrolase family 3 C-terminal domain-containing protein [Spirochaetia bacterium]
MAKTPYLDPDLTLEERVHDLLGRMTLEEKVSQMVYESKAIPRLGIPEYNWWNEGLHGVGRAGIATVFPQAIGLAASFDTSLLERIATAVSDEARAKHHEYARQGYRRQYHGLTLWSPNVNIFRDPRWGRGQETYGEDPYLSGRMGVAFVKGIQGNDPRYVKLAATPKHFAAHSGPEALRHEFDAQVGARDMRDTYLPAFRDCVVEGRAESVMGAYNRTNGEPCCGSPALLGQVLRKEWGFAGYVVSDCGAIFDFHAHHKVTKTAEESAALAVRNGCDLECGRVFPALVDAEKQGLITEVEIDAALTRLLCIRFRLGMFDPPERVPYASIPYDKVDCEEHRALALDAARASIVLLKNEAGILPLRKDLGCIAVIGPNADDREALLGNYNGRPSRSTTILEGIRRAVDPSTRVLFAQGSDIVNDKDSIWGEKADDGFGEALAAVERADVVVLVLGLSARLEGEEGSASLSQWQGDRISIELPTIQRRLFDAVAAKAKPIVLVLLTGSALAIPHEDELSRAVLLAWYPGEEGGQAVADALFGDSCPSGRLPVTWVKSVDDLPPFTDYSMRGRTYRYFQGEPLYPFGFGLSYTRFSYSRLVLEPASLKAGDELHVSVDVTNTGHRDGGEVVQLYLSWPQMNTAAPLRKLVGFQRTFLAAGETRRLTFTISDRLMSLVNERGERALEPGRLLLSLGGRQPDKRSEELARTPVLTAELDVGGSRRVFPD